MDFEQIMKQIQSFKVSTLIHLEYQNELSIVWDIHN